MQFSNTTAHTIVADTVLVKRGKKNCMSLFVCSSCSWIQRSNSNIISWSYRFESKRPNHSDLHFIGICLCSFKLSKNLRKVLLSKRIIKAGDLQWYNLDTIRLNKTPTTKVFICHDIILMASNNAFVKEVLRLWLVSFWKITLEVKADNFCSERFDYQVWLKNT